MLATLDVADSFGTRFKGLLGRREYDGAFLIKPAMSVHTFGMKFAIDVAFCDAKLKVVDTITMQPFRMSVIRPKARCVIEAQAGSFERWGLRVGDELEIK